MTVPSKSDIEKRKQKLDKMLRSLNEDGSMSEAKICTQLRSAVRQVWKMHDVKVSYLLKKSYPDMDPTTRTKWLVNCECCGKPMKVSDAAVDHIVGEHSLKTIDDLVPFAKSILFVSHDDLQILCDDCHSIKTYSERYNVPIEEAKLEVNVIQRLKKPTADQKRELIKLGFKSSEVTNEEKRRNCYRQLVKEGRL